MLPTETEERVKRRILSACQEHLRKVLELTRRVPQMAECFAKNDKAKAKQLYSEIRVGEDEVDNARRLVSQELAEVGAVLFSREDFLRFASLASDIADSLEGAAFRLVEIMEHKWNVPTDIKKGLLKLSESVLETVIRLRETAMVLSYGPAKTMEKARDVEVAERAVDEIYRELDLKLLNSKLSLPALMLLRDVLLLLENSADRAEDAADVASALSLIV